MRPRRCAGAVESDEGADLAGRDTVGKQGSPKSFSQRRECSEIRSALEANSWAPVAKEPSWSKHPGFPEAIKSPCEWIVRGGADDYVVEKLNVHGLGRFPKLASHLKIGSTWGRVPAYTAYGISGVMPHPVLCRIASGFHWRDERRHAA